MLDTVTPIAQKVAGEAFDAFEQRKRDDGETFTTLRDGAPKWVHDAVMEAHGDFLPEDWRYDKIQDAFGAIQDASADTDLVEVGDEFADSAVDVYTFDRLKWLSSNLNRPGYCDEAQSEGLVNADSDLVERVGMGQYMEAREIWSYVLSAVETRCDEIEDTETGEEK